MTVKNFSFKEVYRAPLNKHFRNYQKDGDTIYNYLYGSFFIDGDRFLPIEKNTLSTSLDLFTISKKEKFDIYFSNKHYEFLRNNTDDIKIFKNSFIIGNDKNYFHNLIYFLPRIIFLLNNEKLLSKIDHLIFNVDLPKYFFTLLNEILKFKNINKKLVLIKKSTYLFEDSYCPTILGRGKEIEKNVKFWEYIINNITSLSKSNKLYYEKIYISRSDSAHRKILNEIELIELLKKLNFQIITLSEMNIFDQINLFKKAKVIIGYHGAGFANLVFSHPKTKVVEIHPHPEVEFRDDIKIISDIKQLEHKFFFVDYKSNIENSNNMTYFDGIVDISKFNNFIKNY